MNKNVKSFGTIIIAMLACIFSVQAVSAQGTRCRLFGNVRDDKGNPIELASVRVAGSASGTLTNLKGNYSFYCTSRDTVTVVFSMVGYETRKRLLSSPTDSVRLDVVLPSLDMTLGTATVTGQRIQTGTMQKLGNKNLTNTPSATGNAVEEMIATQAGVSTHNELSSQYNVRGGSFDENCVYINGIEVYRPMLVRSGQQEGLSIINSDMVENIGFSSGGFEAKYGDKMSSVLDITYKKPHEFEAKVNASMLGAGGYVGFGNEKFSMVTSVRYKTTRHLLGTMDTNGEYRPNFLDYQAYLSWSPNQRWTFDLMGNISDNHYNFKPTDRETRFGTMEDVKSFKVYFDGQEKDYFKTYFGAFTATRRFSKSSSLSLQLSSFTTKEHENYDIQGEYWLNEATSQSQLGVGTYMEHARNSLQGRVVNMALKFDKRFTGHHLQTGLAWRNELVKENSREWEMRDSMGYSLPHNPYELKLIYSLRSHNQLNANKLELFAQDTWRLKSKAGLFTLNYGIRLTHYDWNKETLISPRASVGFLPANNENLTLRFATGVYYQAPFYKELRDTVTVKGVSVASLSTDIKSQRSIHFVLGGDYNFTMLDRPFKFTTEVYYKALSRLIPYTVNNMRLVYYGKNLSNGFAAGVDFKLYGEFVPDTDSWLTLSIMSTKEKINGMMLPRPTDQRYNISLHFTDYFPGSTRWTLTLRAAIADGLPFSAPHSGLGGLNFRAPSYKRVDVGMSYKILDGDKYGSYHRWGKVIKRAWLGLDVFNLLGISNVNSYY